MTISHSFFAKSSRLGKQKASTEPTLMNFLRLGHQYFISNFDFGSVILMMSLGSISGLYIVKYIGLAGIVTASQYPLHLLSPLSLTEASHEVVVKGSNFRP